MKTSKCAIRTMCEDLPIKATRLLVLKNRLQAYQELLANFDDWSCKIDISVPMFPSRNNELGLPRPKTTGSPVERIFFQMMEKNDFTKDTLLMFIRNTKSQIAGLQSEIDEFNNAVCSLAPKERTVLWAKYVLRYTWDATFSEYQDVFGNDISSVRRLQEIADSAIEKMSQMLL